MNDEVAALQRTLAGENAAVYGYGVVGAHAPDRDRGTALVALARCRARRDALRSLLIARGATPGAAAAAYGLPFPVTSGGPALRLAIRLEEALAATYFALISATDDAELRRFAAVAMQEQAARAAGWRTRLRLQLPTTPFPGRPS